MPEHDHDPWRMPTLDAFGDQLTRLEQRGGASHRRSAWASAGLLLAVMLAAGAFFVVRGGTAGALSIINRAPAAAIRSASVAYRSAITILVAGKPVRRFTQQGEISFAKRAYRTRLRVLGSGVSVEWRSVGGVLYRTEAGRSANTAASSRWIAADLSGNQQSALAAAPEQDALTDPLAVLRLLSKTTAKPRFLGYSQVEGVTCRRYRLTTNLASMLRASAGATRLPLAYRHTSARVDVWLDSGGRPRRVHLLLSSLSGRTPAVLAADLVFSDYGAPILVARPPAARPSTTLHGVVPRPLIGGPSRIYERLILPHGP
jgi:hypothetical protein